MKSSRLLSPRKKQQLQQIRPFVFFKWNPDTFSRGWAQTWPWCRAASSCRSPTSAERKQSGNASAETRNPAERRGLTASLLRRSCSRLRAVSLSLSTADCAALRCVSTGDSGGWSASSFGASDSASLEMFPAESGSSLTAGGFGSVLHGPATLEGESRRWVETVQEVAPLIPARCEQGIMMENKVWTKVNEFEYQVFPEASFSLTPSPCFLFSALTRSSFSMAALRNSWKTSFDDLTDAGLSGCFANFAQESAFFRTMSWRRNHLCDYLKNISNVVRMCDNVQFKDGSADFWFL